MGCWGEGEWPRRDEVRNEGEGEGKGGEGRGGKEGRGAEMSMAGSTES